MSKCTSICRGSDEILVEKDALLMWKGNLVISLEFCHSPFSISNRIGICSSLVQDLFMKDNTGNKLKYGE